MNYDAQIVSASVYRAGAVEPTKRTRKVEDQGYVPRMQDGARWGVLAPPETARGN